MSGFVDLVYDRIAEPSIRAAFPHVIIEDASSLGREDRIKITLPESDRRAYLTYALRDGLAELSLIVQYLIATGDKQGELRSILDELKATQPGVSALIRRGAYLPHALSDLPESSAGKVAPSLSPSPRPAQVPFSFAATWFSVNAWCRNAISATVAFLHRLRAFDFATWCRDTFGPIEFSESVRRIGYNDGESCRSCRKDLHDDGEMCPEQRSADCSACGQRVLLTYWGCPRVYVYAEVQRTHRLSNIAPTTREEWTRRGRLKARRLSPKEIA